MNDRLQAITGGFLRLLILGNLAIGIIFVGALLASVPSHAALVARLAAKYGAGVDHDMVVNAIRVVALAGIASVGALHQMLGGLRAILASVAAGDPFRRDTGDRLVRIGWALLALQLLDIVVGVLVGWLNYLDVETATWTPSLVGWLGVLLAFVLAQVFRRGAEMRDELAMTV